MEFICVLSVNGVLVKYAVTAEDDGYSATLCAADGREERLPPRVRFGKKNAGGWVACPADDVVAPAICKAIEADR